jgi:hypothetical protein
MLGTSEPERGQKTVLFLKEGIGAEPACLFDTSLCSFVAKVKKLSRCRLPDFSLECRT